MLENLTYFGCDLNNDLTTFGRIFDYIKNNFNQNFQIPPLLFINSNYVIYQGDEGTYTEACDKFLIYKNQILLLCKKLMNNDKQQLRHNAQFVQEIFSLVKDDASNVYIFRGYQNHPSNETEPSDEILNCLNKKRDDYLGPLARFNQGGLNGMIKHKLHIQPLLLHTASFLNQRDGQQVAKTCKAANADSKSYKDNYIRKKTT